MRTSHTVTSLVPKELPIFNMLAPLPLVLKEVELLHSLRPSDMTADSKISINTSNAFLGIAYQARELFQFSPCIHSPQFTPKYSQGFLILQQVESNAGQCLSSHLCSSADQDLSLATQPIDSLLTGWQIAIPRLVKDASLGGVSNVSF